MTICNDVNQVNSLPTHSKSTRLNALSTERIPKANKYPRLSSLQISQIQSYDALCLELNKTLKPPSDFPTFLHYKSYVRKQRELRLHEVLSRYTSDIDTYLHASVLKDAKDNPTNFTNTYWQSVVKLNIGAYQIDSALGLHLYQDIYDKSDIESFEASRNPLWSMQRMGQSCTVLPDGTEVLIGGEYEDYYDPQFCIYNDVIVKYPDGSIEVYGYPKHIFPPTDFHTATLVDDEIWIIGSLGYVGNRQFSQTQVCILDIDTFHMRKLETLNSMGWVHNHQATYQDGQIIIHRGKLLIDDDSPFVYEPNSWALNLRTLTWKKLTQRQWQGFYIARKDKELLHLGTYEFLSLCESDEAKYKEVLERFSQNTGISPDLTLYKTLFIPPIKHEVDNLTDDHSEVVILIDDIKVRFLDERDSLQVYIEGILPESTVKILKDSLQHKLQKLENMACDVVDFD